MSDTDWFHFKYDGSLCFCPGFHTLNAVLLHDLYPLPYKVECINNLGEPILFRSLDINLRRWTIEIDKQESDENSLQLQSWFVWLHQRAIRTCKRSVHVPESNEGHPCHCSVADCDVIPRTRRGLSRVPAGHFEQIRGILQLLYYVLYISSVALRLKRCKSLSEKIRNSDYDIRPGRSELGEHSAVLVTKPENPGMQTELHFSHGFIAC